MKEIVLVFLDSPLMTLETLNGRQWFFLIVFALMSLGILAIVIAQAVKYVYGAFDLIRAKRERAAYEREQNRLELELRRIINARSRRVNFWLGIKDEQKKH